MQKSENDMQTDATFCCHMLNFCLSQMIRPSCQKMSTILVVALDVLILW